MNKKDIRNRLKECFKKCGHTRRKLRKYAVNALNAGLTREEILAITDDIVGGFGKDEVSVCAIITVEQVLIHNETKELKKIVKMYAPYMEFPDE